MVALRVGSAFGPICHATVIKPNKGELCLFPLDYKEVLVLAQGVLQLPEALICKTTP